MSFVIDASVVIAWAFKEEHATAELTFARIQAEEAIAPAAANVSKFRFIVVCLLSVFSERS